MAPLAESADTETQQDCGGDASRSSGVHVTGKGDAASDQVDIADDECCPVDAAPGDAPDMASAITKARTAPMRRHTYLPRRRQCRHDAVAGVALRADGHVRGGPEESRRRHVGNLGGGVGLNPSHIGPAGDSQSESRARARVRDLHIFRM